MNECAEIGKYECEERNYMDDVMKHRKSTTCMHSTWQRNGDSESGTVTSNTPTKMDPVEKVHHQVFRSHFEHNKIYFVIAFGVFINHRNTRLDC